MLKDKLDRGTKAWLISVVFAAAIKDEGAEGGEAFNALMEELGL